MAMSRKDYVQFAVLIKEQWDAAELMQPSDRILVRNTLGDTASGMAAIFRIDNSNFDRDRFLTACGIK